MYGGLGAVEAYLRRNAPAVQSLFALNAYGVVNNFELPRRVMVLGYAPCSCDVFQLPNLNPAD